MTTFYDVVVVGSGVNGLVAASILCDHGLKVLLIEGRENLGGGVRTEALTLPGFWHDVCSAVHPFARSSPALKSMQLEDEGLEWVDSDVPLVHPLLGEPAIVLSRDVESTAQSIGGRGGERYARLMKVLLRTWAGIQDHVLGPQLRLPPKACWEDLGKFGLLALSPAAWSSRFLGRRGAALWAGLAGHSLLPMASISSSAVACVLGLMGHLVGWPMPKGGAGSLARALEARLRRQGVKIETGRWVKSLAQLPRHRALLLDLTARPLVKLLGPLLSARKRKALGRFQLGPGVFKVDYALSRSMPWLDREVTRAATVHLGGSMEEIAVSEDAVWKHRVSDRPYLLVVQPGTWDPSRAPLGQATLWVYAHVPHGFRGDCRGAIEAQLERYAPGFRESVLAAHVTSAEDFENVNPNYVGGDILGGANVLSQVIARPFVSIDPYHLGGRYFCCSALVPPGGGIHGMGGFHAAQSLLGRLHRLGTG